MKSLFDEDFRYTPDAATVSAEICESLEKIMRTYVAKGYSPREIAAIMHGDVTMIETEAVLALPNQLR